MFLFSLKRRIPFSSAASTDVAASSEHRLARPTAELVNLDRDRETENSKRKYCEIKTPEEMKEEILTLTFKLAEANQKVDRLTNVNLSLLESKV